MEADEAERCGLVSRGADQKLMDEAMGAAAKIAEKSMMAVMAAKEAVNRSYETTLDEGCYLNVACSIRSLRQRTKKKEWLPLSRNAKHSFVTNNENWGVFSVFGL